MTETTITEYGEVLQTSISGEFDGSFRVVTDDEDGDLHEFNIPYSVSHDGDRFYVDFSFEAVDHEFGPADDETRETITCPESIKSLATQSKQEILKNANP